jgi:molybdopterin converting factor small subunit
VIRINYASWLSVRLQKDYDEFLLPLEVSNISKLIDWLMEQNSNYRSVFSHQEVIYAACNGAIISHETEIGQNDEITFFAPIAGG